MELYLITGVCCYIGGIVSGIVLEHVKAHNPQHIAEIRQGVNDIRQAANNVQHVANQAASDIKQAAADALKGA